MHAREGFHPFGFRRPLNEISLSTLFLFKRLCDKLTSRITCLNMALANGQIIAAVRSYIYDVICPCVYIATYIRARRRQWRLVFFCVCCYTRICALLSFAQLIISSVMGRARLYVSVQLASAANSVATLFRFDAIFFFSFYFTFPW